MELRHLRYFIAVAEEGSLSLAAARRLHTAQPSLSRQIRDLEREVGAALLLRGARGIELTAAGRVFLDHARLALLQIEAAGAAARRAVRPDKPGFTLGFLTGHEMDWLPESLRLLRAAAPETDVTLTSQSSPDLAAALLRGQVDVAFLRREPLPGLAFRPLTDEALVVVLPAAHRLAGRPAIGPQDLATEVFIGVPASSAPVLRQVIDRYAARCGIDLTPDHAVDNLSMAISLVASTGGVSLLPRYAEHFLPPSVVSRPLLGEAPRIELVLGYSRASTSPLLKLFLGQVDALIRRVTGDRGLASRTGGGL